MEEFLETEMCDFCNNTPCLWFVHTQTIVSTVKEELGNNFPSFVMNWNPEIYGNHKNTILMENVLEEKSFDGVDETHHTIKCMCYSTNTRLVHGYLGRDSRKKTPFVLRNISKQTGLTLMIFM